MAKILLVDDAAFMRMMIKDTLSKKMDIPIYTRHLTGLRLCRCSLKSVRIL